MAESRNWAFPQSVQPKPDEVRFDLDLVLDAVVMVHSEVPDDAFTASILCTERVGNVVVIREDGVVLTIVKQPHADTRAVTNEIKSVLRAAQRTLPDIAINTELFQPKSFIDRGIYYVAEAMAIGAVLVIVILFLFLLNFRTTFITLTAIPLSLMMTAVAFRAIGLVTGSELSINVMTLGGIAVAIGELVDDAIVDVENIFRRLRENRERGSPLQYVFPKSGTPVIDDSVGRPARTRAR